LKSLWYYFSVFFHT